MKHLKKLLHMFNLRLNLHSNVQIYELGSADHWPQQEPFSQESKIISYNDAHNAKKQVMST